MLLSCQYHPSSAPPEIKIAAEFKQPTIKPVVDKTCPGDMVHVNGMFCNYSSKCTEWIDKKRCKTFSKESICNGPEKELNFCMDREEYNVDGHPLTFITFNQAKNYCKKINKRLCTEQEFVLSCGGQERLPYPYGYERNDYCNIDHKAFVKNKQLVNESNPIWENPNCISPFGVHNLIGNTDEWYESSGGTRYKSTLHGGFWGYVRGRCEFSSRTTEHFEEYAGTQTGFRCCSNVK